MGMSSSARHTLQMGMKEFKTVTDAFDKNQNQYTYDSLDRHTSAVGHRHPYEYVMIHRQAQFREALPQETVIGEKPLGDRN